MNLPAEVFPPGEFLRDELEARGWSQTEMAEIMGRPIRLINELIAGKKSITPETAIQLAQALGTSPDLWMNLESQFQLSKVRESDGLIARRARLYERFAVREMIRRGWIEASKNIDVLEQQFLRFFSLASLDAPLEFSHAAKKAAPAQPPTALQYAWLFRVRQIATEMTSPKYSEKQLRLALPKLAALLTAPEESRHAPRLLEECGVRLLVVEPIPGSKIDGACFWLSNDRPVIALSLRLDRIDNFWFVLRHEIEHVLCGHGRDRDFILDQDLEGSSSDTLPEEVLANEAGQNFCVSTDDLTNFISRVAPFFKEERVVLFAQRLQVHPGIVVGQLQRRLLRYDLFRKYQVKVRHIVTSSARTDGWGVLTV